jgi:biotin-dependent carboxylase-like uncharacterized protein
MTGPVLTVHEAGIATTVQDLGRPGHAAWGVGRSGACDRGALALANRLVGNPPGRAALEITLGGLVVSCSADVLVALAGARCPGAGHHAPLVLRAGQRLSLGRPDAGLRTYLAVRGGIDVPPVLGSRSTDVLSGLGPAPVTDGAELPLLPADGLPPGVDVAPVAEPTPGTVTVGVGPGPRRDWFPDEAWATLVGTAWRVSGDSDRVGLRLEGPSLPRRRAGELPSEGVLAGALQVPPAGTPVLFLADHPVTGGYPVIGYVDDVDVDRCGQLRPGQQLRLSPTGPPRARPARRR